MAKKNLLKRVCILGLAVCGAISFYYLVSPSPTGNPDASTIMTAKRRTAKWTSFPDVNGSYLETGKLHVTPQNIIMATVVIIVVVIILYTILFKLNVWKTQSHSQNSTPLINVNTNNNRNVSSQHGAKSRLTEEATSALNTVHDNKSDATSPLAPSFSLLTRTADHSPKSAAHISTPTPHQATRTRSLPLDEFNDDDNHQASVVPLSPLVQPLPKYEAPDFVQTQHGHDKNEDTTAGDKSYPSELELPKLASLPSAQEVDP